VFWVHASNAARFEQAYRDIATMIELPGLGDPKVDILQLVYNWLCDEANGRWLMILDNADDDSVFFPLYVGSEAMLQGSEGRNRTTPLARFIPQSRNGWILVTSRNKRAAGNLVGTYDNVIDVLPMDEEDALALLSTRVPFDESCKGDARALVHALECIPLAVTQAAAYIRIREPVITISTYLQLFRVSERNQTHLLSNEEARDLRRDPSMRDAIITTWQMSFDQIQKMRPSATDLLALMSMFDGQGIPERLLHDGRNRLQFLDDITPLTSFSLIRVQIRQENKEQTFEMHPLVQLTTRKWLELNGQIGNWRKESLRVMELTFPSGEHGTWAACQMLLPHSRMILAFFSNNENEVLYRAKVAHRTAYYLLLKGELTAAEEMAGVAVDGMEKVLGPGHIDTLSCINDLALLLREQGKYEEAEELNRRVLEGYEKSLGKMHPYTLTSISNLIDVLRALRKYTEAEELGRQVLESREIILGKEYPDTLRVASKLAAVLQSQGKYIEAKELNLHVLESGEKVLGKEHPETIGVINNVAAMLGDQGFHKAAEELGRRHLEFAEKILGKEHPNTLVSVNNLAVMLQHQGRYEEAEELGRRALESRKKVLGKGHPDTLSSIANLAFILRSQGKFEEADALN